MEYIAFLKSLPTTSQQEESQRMTSVRKIYQRAIITPTHHVEQLWKDYENFENSVSRQLAKGLLSEYQPKFNSARAVYRERKKFVDEIDWNLLAVPPMGSLKEEQQFMAWKRFLAFEKGNPQRIDSASANKRIAFTYEQCLMYLYHYPDIWYDYAMWHAKNGSVDSAIKIFQRALKALPESESLRFAYAELEESRGAAQAAKGIYENLLSSTANTTALSHIQFIRFLRRTEGSEAARKYFLEARKSPNCTYHVYVAYALMVFCLDKDAKVAQNIFEAGLKRYIHEPGYILDYADFLCRINDDRNVRALFERALSLLPPEESVEIWKRFTLFEQTYGDLASVLKVEQRKKEALSRGDDDVVHGSLYEVVSRYSFMDLWPCSSKELDHLARQEWLTKNVNKKIEKASTLIITDSVDKASAGLATGSKAPIVATQVVLPDTSRMVIYDPGHMQGNDISVPSVPLVGSATVKGTDELLKALPHLLASFISNIPTIEGPSPNIDVVLSILLQSNIQSVQASNPASSATQLTAIPGPTTSELSGSSKTRPQPNGSLHGAARRHMGRRQDNERQEDDDTVTIQSRPLPPDAFRLRQMRRARGISSASQTGSVSGGSVFSGEQSGSTG